MLSDVAQHTGQRSDAETRVARNRDVVLAALEGRQSNMAAGLTSHPVAQISEDLCQVIAGDIAGQSHAVMISSRTK